MAGIKPTLYIEDGVLRDLEQDIFGHKHIADAVVDSILHTDPPFTIGIFGGWGTGKSSLLKIIDSKLSSNKIATATIDAWRYSSADNLRRAFLVHVANELTPKLLDDLRRKLFSSEQETLPAKPSRLDTTSKTLWDTVWDGTKIILRLASKLDFIHLDINKKAG
jgi:predicted KAP-like P-loop ATPase